MKHVIMRNLTDFDLNSTLDAQIHDLMKFNVN